MQDVNPSSLSLTNSQWNLDCVIYLCRIGVIWWNPERFYVWIWWYRAKTGTASKKQKLDNKGSAYNWLTFGESVMKLFQTRSSTNHNSWNHYLHTELWLLPVTETWCGETCRVIEFWVQIVVGGKWMQEKGHGGSSNLCHTLYCNSFFTLWLPKDCQLLKKWSNVYLSVVCPVPSTVSDA